MIEANDQRKILHPLVHFPDARNSQAWTELELGVSSRTSLWMAAIASGLPGYTLAGSQNQKRRPRFYFWGLSVAQDLFEGKVRERERNLLLACHSPTGHNTWSWVDESQDMWQGLRTWAVFPCFLTCIGRELDGE